MKTLYLHIGMARTGTTSIQNFCTLNESILNKNGYTYPLMPFEYPYANRVRNAHFLFGRVKNTDGTLDFKTQEQWRQEGFTLLYDAFKQYDNVILSDEGLWNCGIRDGHNVWHLLREEMLQHGFQTKIIVYLRRQDDYLTSWWGQRVKEGRYFQRTFTWEEMLEKMPVVQLDYYQVLENISLHIGRENILVRRFGKEYFLNHSLYEDFLQAINLHYDDSYHIEEDKMNQGITANNIEIKRIINHIPDLSPKNNYAFRNMLIDNSNISSSNVMYNMFSEKEALAFFEKYRKSNHMVAKHYLGMEDDLFEFSYKADKKWSRQNEDMLNDVVLFSAKEFIALQNNIDAINKDMNQRLDQQQKQINYILNILQHPFQTIQRKIKKRML